MVFPETPQTTDGPITMVIFGASGDLTRRKLVPALASLHSKGRVPGNLQVLGVARSDMDDVQFPGSSGGFSGRGRHGETDCRPVGRFVLSNPLHARRRYQRQ